MLDGVFRYTLLLHQFGYRSQPLGLKGFQLGVDILKQAHLEMRVSHRGASGRILWFVSGGDSHGTWPSNIATSASTDRFLRALLECLQSQKQRCDTVYGCCRRR